MLTVPPSAGQLAKLIGKVSAALEAPYQQLLEALPGEASLNVDETGHKDNGKQHWTWSFWAHLIRDVKFLTTLSDKATHKYGTNVLARLRRLFQVIHRQDRMSQVGFQRALAQARKHGDAYFQFITTPGIEPTNNLAEPAIRFVVIDRRITQGTRGQAGCRWSERIWTTIATCTQQGQSVFEFLQRAVHAHFTGQPAPSLLFDTS